MKEKFKKIIKELEKDLEKNKDLIEFNNRSLVGCALITKDGKVFKGMNVAWWHSNCAEVVALGNGLMAGERNFEYLISVKLNKRNNQFQVISPCGICREMFNEFELNDLKVVLQNEKGEFEYHTIISLLPFSF